MQNKQYCRDLVKKEFDKLSPEDLTSRSTSLIDNLIKGQSFDKSNKIMVYLPLRDEVQIQSLFKIKKDFYIPKIEGDSLSSVKLFENTAINPSDLDLIIVPGRAFTKSGVRIGRGAGYYDRFLAGAKVPTIALALSFQIFSELPQAEHDIRISQVITE